MNSYQFMKKDTAVIHLELGTETFVNEQSQLLEQGFELAGQPLKAESLQDAYQLHKQAYGADDNEYPLIGSFADVSQALALNAIIGG
ncbi:hypothetical protein K6Q96_16985 [Grimontia kaedaensis]|uniref:Uncharacterized protein n=1 Tax=Grimontia kaedaensis TaxID=2872157 RepID=A0ABY4X0Z7_9GAMM|nr:hypothetical protein [Grimontia kaedaensis]USH04939.1 hypothetical protein K6Q96_16985 [Grimontia kaedaensis]